MTRQPKIMTSDFCRLWSIPPGHQGAAKDLWKWVTWWVFLPEEIHGTCSFVVQIFSTKLYPRNLQQVQQDSSWMDPEKAWESNSSIATLLGVRWDSVPFNFWWILGICCEGYWFFGSSPQRAQQIRDDEAAGTPPIGSTWGFRDKPRWAAKWWVFVVNCLVP